MSSITKHYTTSKDGTNIGYLKEGTGPGVLLIQGAGGVVEHYSQLATALSAHFTVYTVERRGRGLSPKAFTAEHDIQRDVEDIEAVMRDTGSTRVFGLSSGAIICLEAARVISTITHAVVYEPPFYDEGRSMRSGVEQLGRDIDNDDHASAALTVMDTSDMKPLLFQVLPTTLSWGLLWTALRINSMVAKQGYSFKEIIAASRYDFKDVSDMQDRMGTLADSDCAVMVMHGSDSQEFFEPAARRVEATVPGCKRVVMQGMTHAGPWNRRYGGKPERVASALVDFMQ